MKRVCIDVGGTFTDCLVLDETGTLEQFKAPTTPSDPSAGFIDSVQKAARHYGLSVKQFVSDIDLLIHGTTLATNTLLTGRGAKTGMITTKGMRDIVEIRRGIKTVGHSMYHVIIPPYKPLIPRFLRRGVQERTLYTGEIRAEVDAQETREAAAELKQQGVESVAVCFLHSYANPENEQKAVSLVREVFGDGVHLAASHNILPVWREFERFSTTCVSAYVGPIVARYLTTLENRLSQAGFKGTLLMMLSNGYVQTVAQCRDRAVYLISSGPAAAPSGAVHLGRSVGHANLLSIDMGGTSFDVCLVHDGEIPTTTESWVGQERAAIKMVDVSSVGAGGGSIAWIDTFGLLRVGPQSAGADPGPACYGKGTDACVTDADLVLGYISPDFFLGGEIALDECAARRAIETVAAPLDLSIDQAAEAIFTTVNHVMADQISEVSTKRGHDVRDFTLVAGGGAGPVHGASIAQVLGIPTVLVPSVAALYSAFGMFAMDVGRDYARSFPSRASTLDLKIVNRLYRDMEEQARIAFGEMGAADGDVRLARTAEMRYVGQFHEVEVEIPVGELTTEAIANAVDAFHKRHATLYTFAMPFLNVEFLTFRLKATVPRKSFTLRQISRGRPDSSQALKRRRSCLFAARHVDTPVFDGERVLAGNIIEGPAVVEELTTTVVVPPGFQCEVDEYRNYVLRARA
jgi:N-methylhydantoinase A